MMAHDRSLALSVGTSLPPTRQIEGITRQIRDSRHDQPGDPCYLSGPRPYLSDRIGTLSDRKTCHRMAAPSQLTPYERTPRAICRVSGDMELGK